LGTILKAFIDFIPVLFFFLSYIFYTDIPISFINDVNSLVHLNLNSEKSSGIYFATFILMVSYSIQFLILFYTKSVKKIHYITLFIILIAGFSTLYFKNPFFIKIKPSIVYWGFALFFIVNHVMKRESIIKKLLQEQVTLSKKNWDALSYSWIIFFIGCGIINLYVANFFTEEKWVEFKFYVLGMILPVIFIMLNGIFIGVKTKNK
jgi:intracellular septation protein